MVVVLQSVYIRASSKERVVRTRRTTTYRRVLYKILVCNVYSCDHSSMRRDDREKAGGATGGRTRGVPCRDVARDWDDDANPNPNPNPNQDQDEERDPTRDARALECGSGSGFLKRRW